MQRGLLVLLIFALSGCLGWLQPQHQVHDPAAPVEDPLVLASPLAQSVFQGDIQHSGYFPNRTLPDAVALAWQLTPWNVGTHSAAKGSPVEADGIIYAAADDGTLAAVRPDGSVVWRVDLTAHSRGSHGTPLVTTDAVYIGTYDGYLHRVERAAGDVVWQKKLGGSVAASPLIFEDRLYISVETAEPSGRFYALDPDTGATIWKDLGITDHPHSSIAIDPQRRIAVVGANDGILYAWDIDRQQRLWTFTTKGAGDGDIKAPILIADGAAFFGSWDHNVYRVDLATGQADWRFVTTGKVMGAPALDPTTRTLYIGGHDKTFRALDIDAGAERWSYRTDGWIVGAATVTDDAVLFGSYDRHLYALDKLDGHLLWRYPVGGYPTSAPLVLDAPDGALVVFADRACHHGDDGKAMRGCGTEGPGSLWALRTDTG